MALSVTHTAVVVIPDDPSVPVGSDEWNAPHALAGKADLTQIDESIAPTWTGLHTYSATISASQSALLLNGALYASGTGTTTVPAVFFQPSGAAAVTTWSTSGTFLGVNAASGFAGNFVDFHSNGGASVFRVNASGAAVLSGNINTASNMVLTNNAGIVQLRNGNTIISSPVDATTQLGNAAAASPVAQTLQAQGSRAGTDSNVGGASLTVTSGAGTGTGTISQLDLKSPVAVASSTGAQTQTTGLTIKGGQAVLPTYTVATLPTGIKGGMAQVTDGDNALAWGATVVNSGAGATYYQVNYNGTNWTVVGK